MSRPTVAQFLKAARGELGYVEGSNNDTKYGKWYGLNHNPWCDMFVSWCGAQIGGSDVIGKYAATMSHASWFKKISRWGRSPKVGAIVFFDFDEKQSTWTSHVGIVEAVRDDGRIVTIEGNTSSGTSGSQHNGGGVYRRVRAANSVVGYGYPNYASSTSTPDTPVSTYPTWPGRLIKLTDPLMQGQDVKTWQAQMAKRGWTIGVDGVYGNQSREVCVAFQREKKLEVDGVIGKATWDAAFKLAVT